MAHDQLQVDNMNQFKLKLSLHPQWLLVQEISEKLKKNGYSCYLVGGSVRDYLLDLQPVDLDLVTEATPAQIQVLFPRVLEMGQKFAVSQVVLGDQIIDLATFRQEDLYFDGRHPEQIVFAGMSEDFHRRDFTINSLYLDLSTFDLYDFCHAKEDIQALTLRTVGDPQKRFLEDHLRLLRAVRFTARFALQVETETRNALVQHRHLIQKLSHARRTEELKKGFALASRAKYFALLNEFGMWDILFPQFSFDMLCLDDPNTAQELQRANWADFLFSLFSLAQYRKPNPPAQSAITRNQKKQQIEVFFSNLLLLRQEKQQMLLAFTQKPVDLERQEPFIFREFLRQLHI
jgi:tRNA nucleotidyltransferase/poly(A) polymerase